MRDRGTIIAGAGIVLAFIFAGVVGLFHMRQEAADRAQEARIAAEQEHANAQFAFDQQQDGMRREAGRTPEQAILQGWIVLIGQQSPDGAWRSETYATFKGGTALTPLVVCALQDVNKLERFSLIDSDPIGAGCDFLAKLVKPDGSIEGAEGDLDFPVYTAALSVIALSHPEQKRHLKARDAWLKFLLSHQLTDKLGWKPEDKQFGGWGYCRLIPKKPAAGAIAPPLVESNLSATVFALEALKAAGVEDHEVYSRAAQFIKKCQNEDGGFHFIYDDQVRNKAGADGDRFHSYGSATADGLRALRLAGETEVVRIEVAEKWLEKHFRADTHPGKYIPAHEANRDAVYFYYAASVSKALRATEEWRGAKAARAGGAEWAPALAAELVKRQQQDGSWMNPVELVRENEPLVATANALIALANCTSK